jgi:hypothetical protein
MYYFSKIMAHLSLSQSAYEHVLELAFALEPTYLLSPILTPPTKPKYNSILSLIAS